MAEKTKETKSKTSRSKKIEKIVIAEPIAESKFKKPEPAKPRKLLMVVAVALVLALAGLLAYKNISMILVARVNGHLIFTSELNKKLTEQYGARTLEDLITISLIKDELSKNKISVSSQEVDAKVEEIQKGLPGMSLEEALKGQGMTMNDLREQISLQLGIEKILKDKVQVSEGEVTEFLASNANVLQSTDEASRKVEAAGVLKDQKLQQEISSWVEELRLKAKITKYL